jgi:hypothetical protein
MKKTILILIVLAAVVGGCSKTKQATKKIYGDWTLTSYAVNGIDSVSLYKDSLGVEFEFFYDDYQENTFCKISGKRNDGIEKSFGWTWWLVNSTTLVVNTTVGNCIGIGPFGNNRTSDWTILKLTRDEFKLKTTYNNKEYEIELEK